MFILNILLCMGSAAILAAAVTGIEAWFEKHPVKEEKSIPLYLKRQ